MLKPGSSGTVDSNFEVSLVSRVSEFQDMKGYLEKPCLKNKKQTKKGMSNRVVRNANTSHHIIQPLK